MVPPPPAPLNASPLPSRRCVCSRFFSASSWMLSTCRLIRSERLELKSSPLVNQSDGMEFKISNNKYCIWTVYLQISTNKYKLINKFVFYYVHFFVTFTVDITLEHVQHFAPGATTCGSFVFSIFSANPSTCRPTFCSSSVFPSRFSAVPGLIAHRSGTLMG